MAFFVFTKFAAIIFYEKKTEMIYIDISKQQAVIFVPLHGRDFQSVGLSFEMTNTTDLNTVTVPITEAHKAGFLAVLTLPLPSDLYAGEWKYEMKGSGEIHSVGLVKVFDGDNAETTQYNSDNTLIQYE